MNLKRGLATRRKSAPLQRLTTFAFGRGSERRLFGEGKLGRHDHRKACSYWWFIVPTSPLVAGLKLLGFALWAVIWAVGVAVLYVVSAVGGFLVGRLIQQGPVKTAHDLPDLFTEGTDWAISFKELPFPPIFVLLPFGAVVALIASDGWFFDHWLWFAVPTGIVVGLIGLGYGYARLLHAPLARWFDKHCPPIEWVNGEHTERASS